MDKHECFVKRVEVKEFVYLPCNLTNQDYFNECLGRVKGAEEFTKEMWERR